MTKIGAEQIDPRLREVARLAEMLFRGRGEHIMVVLSNASGTQWIGCCVESERVIAAALAGPCKVKEIIAEIEDEQGH